MHEMHEPLPCMVGVTHTPLPRHTTGRALCNLALSFCDSPACVGNRPDTAPSSLNLTATASVGLPISKCPVGTPVSLPIPTGTL